ncbi:efflux RND transporter periplasmic adaptor subunit [Phaeocystidibacter luteus]|uniref:Efflux RND transporter periplasmic adaptor subunit n=1 Tax=Phaeocystidibacter luteus TaxID=911197 RepID=A0A6N6RM79_9FLAO|nr:efflux RND transporter periplasmic adaptor subunit [Phaeocystidibacter luteus]KAB2814666.1 efflux RND transporter periplasmic adaptor subunit [Phaeocystidibacter luteus]
MTKLSYLSGTIAATAILLLTACKSDEQQGPPPKPVPVITVSEVDIPFVTEFPGQVYGINDIPIRARVEGFLEEISFSEGTVVQKGQPLYSIDPLPYQARLNSAKSRLAQAEVEGVRAKNDLDRIRPLAERSAVSKSDLDAAVAGYDASQAQIQAAKAEVDLAEIELGYAQISAPITGIIGKTQARVGEYVGRSPNPVILNTVSEIDSFRVEFFVPESQYLILARRRQEIQNSGYEDRVTYSIILSDGEALDVQGRFDFLDRAVERTTGAIRAQVIFPNKDEIVRPGQFVRLRVTEQRINKVVAIPSRAVADLQGQKFVYVINDEGHSERRIVELGSEWDDLVTIRSGLEKGERIILEGIQAAQRGAALVPKDTTFTSVNGVEL